MCATCMMSSCISWRRPREPAEHPLEVVLHDDGLERLVVEDLAEDVGVVVHPPDDALDEDVGEDEAEVLDGVGAGLGDEMLVRQPGRLQLVEEELVGGAELEAEALVEDLDDRREVLRLLLGLLALARVDRRSSSPMPVSGVMLPSLVFSRRRWVSSTSDPRSRRPPPSDGRRAISARLAR